MRRRTRLERQLHMSNQFSQAAKQLREIGERRELSAEAAGRAAEEAQWRKVWES